MPLRSAAFPENGSSSETRVLWRLNWFCGNKLLFAQDNLGLGPVSLKQMFTIPRAILAFNEPFNLGLDWLLSSFEFFYELYKT